LPFWIASQGRKEKEKEEAFEGDYRITGLHGLADASSTIFFLIHVII
jgi:hypothetical protein